MDQASVSQKFQKVVDSVASDISGIRTGRATPSLVENIMVPAYGGTQMMRVMEVASITAPDTTMLVISPWDKSIIGDIRKGILEANMGMNPSIDGEVIRIAFPPLTTEDREKYVKILSGKLENGKVMIRSVRADEMHEIKKKFEGKEITEDDKKDDENKLQELTDTYVGKIETMGEAKKQELLTI
ncbi:MAG: ribosome recycling factor [Microgenomates group bacterium]